MSTDHDRKTACLHAFSERWNGSRLFSVHLLASLEGQLAISLLSVISKMLERHVYYLITEHLSSDHPLANTQWGFQSGKSTVSALLTTTHDWFAKLEAGKEVCSVFFDLQKSI